MYITDLESIIQKQFGNKNNKILLGLSGGVDSSCILGILKHFGYDNLVGVTIQLTKTPENNQPSRACCSNDDIEDARSLCRYFGVSYYVMNATERFKDKVINPFMQGYLEGTTPSPCVLCNQKVKFQDLFDFAHKMEAQYIATGHYANIHQSKDEKYFIYKGIDSKKDQSYFLFSISQNILSKVRFPLGNFTKTQTREIAKTLGVPMHQKQESQNICFVHAGKYGNFIKKNAVYSSTAGNIVSISGKILGQHKGIEYFTVGQRRGINIGGRKNDTDPLYVVAIHVKNHTVVVGHKECLATTGLWAICESLYESLHEHHDSDVFIQFRNNMQPILGVIEKQSATIYKVQFHEPQYGVAKGQAIVFYIKDTLGYKMLGGGWIKDIQQNISMHEVQDNP